MFSGQLKRERRVNLKGASAIESREDVLRRAKQVHRELGRRFANRDFRMLSRWRRPRSAWA